MRVLLAYTIALLSILSAFGQSRIDSVNVYFRVGQYRLDMELSDNRAVMDDCVERIRQADATGNIERVVICAYASPEGRESSNERLARNRCETVADYIVSHSGIDDALVSRESGGVAWERLTQLVANNPDVPSRDQVLDILTNTPVWVYDSKGRIVDGRKRQLMNLKGGRPYKWLLANIFPELRNAVVVTVFLSSTDVPPVPPAPAPIPEEVDDDISSDEDMTPPMPEPEAVVIEEEQIVEVIPSDMVKMPKRQLFALKTNMLFYPLLMPNLEFEWLINERWSVSLEGNVAWWKNDPKHKYYQLATVSPEVRYWFRTKDWWHGFYVGAFAGGGLYDLENGGRGYRGEGGMGGLSFGYMWPVSSRFSLEAGIGAGYMYTRYKEYDFYDGHYVYQQTKSLKYFGPLKLKFSIAWRFGDVIDSKKSISTL